MQNSETVAQTLLGETALFGFCPPKTEAQTLLGETAHFSILSAPNFFGCRMKSEKQRVLDWELRAVGLGLSAYLKNEAELEVKLSLCRQYSLQLFVSAERHLLYLLRQFQQKIQEKCTQIGLFENHVKDEQYTKAYMMCCIKQMEKDRLIIMDKKDIN